MELFIDCEWNSFGGDLISMALVPRDRSIEPFYEVVPHKNPHPWVAEHVIPALGKAQIEYSEFQTKLEEYLAQFEWVEIISDWPEDITWFCRALITGPGLKISTPKLYMRCVSLPPATTNPHNALADAIDNRDAFYGDFDASTSYRWPSGGVQCFHCAERFETHSRAEIHFGARPHQKPLCQTTEASAEVMLKKLRALENWAINQGLEIPQELKSDG